MAVMNTGSSTEDSWTATAHFGKHIPSFFLAQLAPGSALQPRPSILLPRGTLLLTYPGAPSPLAQLLGQG